jgi:hypothetical protein
VEPTRASDYKIIATGSVGSLADAVNNALRSGWLLFGPPFTNGLSGSYSEICQAVIKVGSK